MLSQITSFFTIFFLYIYLAFPVIVPFF